MTDRYYLTDGGHTLISGATGARDDYGGKSTTANWWFSKAVEKGHRAVGVFVNPKGHSHIRGQSVASLKGLAESYRAGHRLFNFQSDNVDPLIQFLRQIPGEKIIVLDEAQSYADSEQMNWVLSQGGNLDSGSIRALVLTQRPWNLSEELRANLPVKIWCGPVTPEGVNFFQSEHMASVIPEVERNMTAPYQWAVTDAGEYQHTNPAVPAAYAGE